MNERHRPLSDWVAAVDQGPHDRTRLLPINDGADRRDARQLTKFRSGWRRAAVSVRPADGVEFTALGLLRDDPSEVVIELDGAGRPIPIANSGLRAIEAVERRWPASELTSAETADLGAESVVLRHALVDRLDSEGSPVPEVYWLLPWDLLVVFADRLTAALDGGAAVPAMRMRHWFGPVGTRFTAAMEQLAEGIRRGDQGMARIGAAIFLRRLQRVEAHRIPPQARDALARLVQAVGAGNEFHAYWARRIFEFLRDLDIEVTRPKQVRLSSLAAATANTGPGAGSVVESLVVPPFTVTFDVDPRRTTTLTIIVETTGVRDTEDAVFLPVDLLLADEMLRFYIAVTHRPEGFAGWLELRGVEGTYQATVNEPPLGAGEMATLTAEDIRPSLVPFRYMSDLPASAAWARTAAQLPTGSPLISVIDSALGEMP